jgi:peptide/nickel transport system permease protein
MRYIMRRVGFYLIALWAAVTINFIIPRLVPGDPVTSMLSKSSINATPAMRQSLENLLGVPHTSLWAQYVLYLQNLLHGDLGVSITHFPTPVTTLLAQEIPWTLGLVGLASIISFFLGTLLGVIVSWKRDSWLDSLATPALTFLSAIPYFWMALMLVLVLVVTYRLLPGTGGYDEFHVDIGLTPDFIGSVIQHGFLPALTIVISSMAGWLLTMRNSMVTTLSEDYVLMAQAKGLTEWRVMMAYAARNAILPNITGFALQLGFVVGGSLLTELVFSYPGVGFQLYNAVTNLDYSLAQGIFLVIALAVLFSNFLADLVYVWLDPRIRQERR